jgi:hypothetical protein
MIYTYGEGAPDGYRVVIDDGTPGDVTLETTIPHRTPQTIERGGFAGSLAAHQAALRLLHENLKAPGYTGHDARGNVSGRLAGSDCVALVQIERAMAPSIEPVHLDQRAQDTLARRDGEWDAREQALT